MKAFSQLFSLQGFEHVGSGGYQARVRLALAHIPLVIVQGADQVSGQTFRIDILADVPRSRRVLGFTHLYFP